MKPTRITLHCSATPNGKGISIDAIRNDHVNRRGYTDIGYHFILNVDGSVHLGRHLSQAGAHVSGENEGNIGICLAGTDQFTDKQWKALRDLLDDLLQEYDLRPWDLYVHNYFDSARKQKKSCPGFEVGQLVAWYLGKIDEAIWNNLFQTKHQTKVSGAATMGIKP